MPLAVEDEVPVTAEEVGLDLFAASFDAAA